MSKSDFQNNKLGLRKESQLDRSLDAVACLKPHGKYLGMDTFSCLHPDLVVLDKTILNFPFDILWIGNQNEIKGFINGRFLQKKKISKFIVYGGYDLDHCSDIIISTASLSDAISHLKSCSFRPGILLLTASDADSAYSMRFFENQIINSQTKK